MSARCGALALTLLALLAAAIEGQQAGVVEVPAVATELGVRYVANEGFLVEGDGKRVLVDGLFGSGVSGYPAPPPELRERIEAGAGEWAGIQVALASHFHPDHFDAPTVARFLSANPHALFVSTPQAVAALKAIPAVTPELLERVRAVLPAEGTVERLEIHGVRIDVLNLHHGPGNPPTENLGVVVTLGARRFLHFGDTEAKMDIFEPYLPLLRGTDLALLPFWFLASEWRAEMVRDQIRPGRIVVGHMPTATAPAPYFARWKSYDGLVGAIRAAFPDARFPGTTGEVIGLTD